MILASCTSNRYVMLSRGEYKQLQQNKKVNYKRYITLSEEFITDKKLLTQTFEYLKMNQVKKLEKFHSTSTDQNDQYYLSSALLSIWKYDFYKAIVELEKVNSEEYNCIKNLLLTDCTYEIGNTSNDELIQKYQKSLDCDYNDQTKEIINIRIKILKYSY